MPTWYTDDLHSFVIQELLLFNYNVYKYGTYKSNAALESTEKHKILFY